MTPAIASEPYSVDAPSFSTSMRSIIAAGICEMSCRPPVVMPNRLPLTSISVRLGPRLRRSMYAPPTASPAARGAVRLTAGLPALVMFCRISATELKPCFWMSSREITRTGAAVSTSTWRMRDPVTSMRSNVVGGAPSGADGVCAWAAAAVAAHATRATRIASRNACRFM